MSQGWKVATAMTLIAGVCVISDRMGTRVAEAEEKALQALSLEEKVTRVIEHKNTLLCTDHVGGTAATTQNWLPQQPNTPDGRLIVRTALKNGCEFRGPL